MVGFGFFKRLFFFVVLGKWIDDEWFEEEGIGVIRRIRVKD